MPHGPAAHRDWAWLERLMITGKRHPMQEVTMRGCANRSLADRARLVSVARGGAATATEGKRAANRG